MPAGTGPTQWPESGQVELGVRPEAIRVQRDGERRASPSSAILEAQVRRLEFNGPDVLATLALGPHRLVARLPASLPIHDRQHLRVTFDLRHAVWFDSESGGVLRPA